MIALLLLLLCCCCCCAAAAAATAAVLAEGSVVQVTVTCNNITEDFSVTLTATAGPDNCTASANATADVTVNTRPTVEVTALANATTVCLTPGNTTSQELLFTVSSSSGDASVIPTVTAGAAICTANTSTVSE
jgi:hypothetical protein